VTDSEKGEAVLIDAPHDVWAKVEPLLAESKCKLVALLLTHGHWDHTGDAAKIQRTGVPVFAHEADRVLIETPEVMSVFLQPGITLEPAKIDHLVTQGQVLELMGCKIEVRHVPGHCPGNVLFYFSGEKVAFVGDALFNGSIGRFDLPGGDFPTLEKSIRTQIYTLPEETIVCPGHGGNTKVGHEMKSNPFVGGGSE
jgi:glyoxylase-like metal-dependent hydrolase (beta-lactamase superfamily II)